MNLQRDSIWGGVTPNMERVILGILGGVGGKLYLVDRNSIYVEKNNDFNNPCGG